MRETGLRIAMQVLFVARAQCFTFPKIPSSKLVSNPMRMAEYRCRMNTCVSSSASCENSSALVGFARHIGILDSRAGRWK